MAMGDFMNAASSAVGQVQKLDRQQRREERRLKRELERELQEKRQQEIEAMMQTLPDEEGDEIQRM